jgi:hypothetical protein
VERFGARDEPSEVVIVPLDGSAPRSVSIPTVAPAFPGEPQRNLSAKWSPDGRSMVLNRETRAWETFVIEHPLAAVGPAPSSR